MRRLITTDSHLVPPSWLLNELPQRLRSKVAGQFADYVECDGKRYLRFPDRYSERMLAAGIPAELEIESDEMLVKLLHLTVFNGVDATPWFDPKGRLIDMDARTLLLPYLSAIQSSVSVAEPKRPRPRSPGARSSTTGSQTPTATISASSLRVPTCRTSIPPPAQLNSNGQRRWASGPDSSLTESGTTPTGSRIGSPSGTLRRPWGSR